MASERQARLADRIRVILAERLERGLRDPRLGFVTITDVKVTGDLQHASVFFTVLGDAEDRAASAEALKSATGMLRSEVGKQLNVRLTPSLEFIPDAIPENADHIAALLREARERDEAVAGLAASAQVRRRRRPVREAARVRRTRRGRTRGGVPESRAHSGLSAHRGRRARPSISSMSPSSASEVIARSRWSASGQSAIRSTERMPPSAASRSTFSTAPRA